MKKSLFVLTALMLILAACGTTPEVVQTVAPQVQTVKETVIVEQTKIVEQTSVVEATREVVVTATPEPVEEGPVQGGSLVYAMNAEPANLDPAQGLVSVEIMVDFQIFDGLLWLDSNLKLQPGLATSWTHNDDYTVFDFELRNDVKFHDGEPFNADAVISWFDRMGADGFPIGVVNQWYSLIDKYEKTGDYSIRITLKAPTLFFLESITQGFPGFGCPKVAASMTPEQFAIAPCGTGPFIFEEWLPGSHIKLKKNPDYNWGSPMFGHTGPAYLDEITFQFVAEDATRSAALQSGDAQVVMSMPSSDAALLKANPDLKILSVPTLGIPQSDYINVSLPPTDDLKVRQAIEYATDRMGIIKTVYSDLQSPAYSNVTSRMQDDFNADLVNLYPYDPEKAKALLDEAGWKAGADGIREKDGKKLQVSIGVVEGWCGWSEFLQANLKAVGFDATITTLSGAAFTDLLTNGTSNLPCCGSIYYDPLGLHIQMGAKSTINIPQIKDPEFDALVDKGFATLDMSERHQIVKDLQAMTMDKAYLLPIYELAFFTGIRSNVVGLVFDGTGFYPWLYDVYLSK